MSFCFETLKSHWENTGGKKKTLNNTKLRMSDVNENKSRIMKNSVRNQVSEGWVHLLYPEGVHLDDAILPRNKALALKRWSGASEGGGSTISLESHLQSYCNRVRLWQSQGIFGYAADKLWCIPLRLLFKKTANTTNPRDEATLKNPSEARQTYKNTKIQLGKSVAKKYFQPKWGLIQSPLINTPSSPNPTPAHKETLGNSVLAFLHPASAWPHWRWYSMQTPAKLSY